MNILALTIWMALIWALAAGQFTLGAFLTGYFISLFVLLSLSRMEGVQRGVSRFGAAIRLIGYFLWELTLANLRVAHEVMTPRLRMRSGIVGVPLELRMDGQITLLAALVALTPGSISIDVSRDRKTIFIHTMYMRDPDSFRREIKSGYERLILEAFG